MNGHRRETAPKGRDSGSATLWAVGGIAVLCLVTVAVLTFGAVVQTQHRATAAADLAALAGAAYAPYGEQAACARASWVATGMRVRLTHCELLNWDVLVEVSAALPDGLTHFGVVTARSRAGPVDRGSVTATTSADVHGRDHNSVSTPVSVGNGRRMADERSRVTGRQFGVCSLTVAQRPVVDCGLLQCHYVTLANRGHRRATTTVTSGQARPNSNDMRNLRS